jgi:hypothetical protein
MEQSAIDDVSQVTPASFSSPEHRNISATAGPRCDESFLEAYEIDGSLDAPYLLEGLENHVAECTTVDNDEFQFPHPNVPKQSAPRDFGYDVFSTQEMSLFRIMTFCDDVGCPRYFFDSLMKLLVCEVVDNKFDLSRKHPVRETLLRRLQKTCPTSPPTSIVVPLENESKLNTPLNYSRGPRDVVEVIRYNFLEQLTDLLSDTTIFGDLANLDVNHTNDRFGQFHRSDGKVDQVNSGSWYQTAYENVISDPPNEFLMPIIMYVDKTGTDVLQRHGVEPLLFTTSVITWKKRQDLRSWRALGFIPDLYTKSTAEKQAASGKAANLGRSQRDYHSCLDKILETLIDVQKHGFIHHLRLGDQVKLVRIRVPVAFVINDGKSADMLCGRYGSYSKGRISRACDVQFKDCGNPHHLCCYIEQDQIQALQFQAMDRLPEDSDNPIVSVVDKKAARLKLKELSTHLVNNAFHKVCFGGDNRGIYGCTPTDLMHAFLEGVLKYCMMVAFASLTVAKRAELDRIVHNVFCCQKNSVRSQFPRADFTHGITNLTLLTATEWGGVCFTLMLLTMMKSGQEVLSSAFGYGEDEDLPGDYATLTDLQELLEALLSFHAWTKCSNSYVCSSPPSIESTLSSIRALLDMIRQRLPRNEGNGWQLQKYHELLHLADDISRFGAPRNTDAGPGERSLKFFAKRQAGTSQKRSSVFLEQVAARLHECAMIARLKRITDPTGEWSMIAFDCSENMCDDDNPNNSIKSELAGSINALFEITFSANQFTGSKWNGTGKGHTTVHPIITKWFCEDQRLRGYQENVLGWTEYIRDNHRFRSHPNYRSNGSWYDWVMVRYEDEIEHSTISPPTKRQRVENVTGASSQEEDPEDDRYPDTYFPAKILCFFRDPVDGELNALVHTCEYSDHTQDSVLCEVWELEFEVHTIRGTTEAYPTLRAVPVSSFDEPVLVLQEMPGLLESVDPIANPYYKRCILVKNRERHWPSKFK